MSNTPVREFPDKTWFEEGPTRGLETVLEAGEVLRFPYLPFTLLESELKFRDPRWASGKLKNISLHWPDGTFRGVTSSTDLAGLRTVMTRYANQSEVLLNRLFPHYRGHLQRVHTALLPDNVVGHEIPWRQDDTRLHVDASRFNPTHGARLLRVFCNINPFGQARKWRLGESFETYAQRYLPRIRRPVPGLFELMHKLRITTSCRTEYDHVMLRLNHLAKADTEFQRSSPQSTVSFAPGTTWVVFSDQVPHAVTSGQHLIEQTFWLAPLHQVQPRSSPLRVLERMLGRPLC
jgi:hypothetical protein